MGGWPRPGPTCRVSWGHAERGCRAQSHGLMRQGARRWPGRRLGGRPGGGRGGVGRTGMRTRVGGSAAQMGGRPRLSDKAAPRPALPGRLPACVPAGWSPRDPGTVGPSPLPSMSSLGPHVVAAGWGWPSTPRAPAHWAPPSLCFCFPAEAGPRSGGALTLGAPPPAPRPSSDPPGAPVLPPPRPCEPPRHLAPSRAATEKARLSRSRDTRQQQRESLAKATRGQGCKGLSYATLTMTLRRAHGRQGLPRTRGCRRSPRAQFLRRPRGHRPWAGPAAPTL